MSRTITVYPTKCSALLIHHPSGGQATQAGAEWPNDGFTARMLTSHLVTTDARNGYTGAAHPLEGKMKQRIAAVAAAQKKK